MRQNELSKLYFETKNIPIMSLIVIDKNLYKLSKIKLSRNPKLILINLLFFF